jgi:Polysaccharide biosynthesis/export protein
MMERSNTFPRALFLALLLTTLLGVAGAQKKDSDPNPLTYRVAVLFPPTGEQYQLRSGDVLSLRVYSHPEFSSDRLRIDERGMIILPLVGEEKAVGRTVKELRSEIVLHYRKYQKNPQVYLRLEAQPARVYAEYDNMGREIRVNTSPMQLDEGKLILKQVSYAGGEEAVLTFSPVEAYQTYELTAWLDGKERVNLNSATKQSQKVYPVHGQWLELWMEVPMKSLARIANATEVKMRLGDREFQLKGQDLEALRFMVRHLSKVPAP